MIWTMPRFETRKPLHVVTFDDLRNTDYRRAFPLMQDRGAVGTSYVIGDRNIRWHEVYEMRDAGWDFQCHSYSHTYLWDLTESELRAEMVGVNAVFEAHGLEVPKHHAYPYGANNAFVKSIIEDYRATQRHTGQPTYEGSVLPYDEVEFRSLQSVHADIATPERMSFVRDAIDYAAQTDGVLITYTHSIVDDITDSSQCLQVYFEEMLDYSLSQGLRIVSVAQMYNILRYHRPKDWTWLKGGR